MKYVHNITFSVFIKPDESLETIKEQLVQLIPLDIEEEKLQLIQSEVTGITSNITILELTLKKERHTNAFLDAFKEKLSSEQLEQLRTQENRLDEQLFYFIRLDKDKLPELILTDSGHCVHIKMSIAAFPKKKENALNIVKELFK